MENLTDKIIFVLCNIASHCWNKHTDIHQRYKDEGKYIDYSLEEVKANAMNNEYHIIAKNGTWVWDDDMFDAHVSINIRGEWKMSFCIRDVFILLDKFCKMNKTKLTMRFTSNHITGNMMTVDESDPKDVSKWRIDGQLLSDLDFGSLNHGDLPLLTSYTVKDKHGKQWTVQRPWNSPRYEFRPRRPKTIKYDGGWWMMLLSA